MAKLLLLLITVAAAADFKQGNDCTDLNCDDRPGTVCQMIVFECTMAPCPPSAECVPKANSCETKKCARGQQCIVRRAFCSADDADCKHRPECVRFSQCGENAEYRECNGEGEHCEATCTNEYPYCAGCGTGGCVCKHGFVRHAGKCIKKEQCPDPECPMNEMWSKCPGNCQQPTCRSILVEVKEVCIEGCGFPQCICKQGFVRNDDGACIKQETCPTKFDCEDANEVKKECSTQCEPSCWERNPVCTKECGPPKCQCKPGYVRQQDFCLPALQCPHIDPMPQKPDIFSVLEKIN